MPITGRLSWGHGGFGGRFASVDGALLSAFADSRDERRRAEAAFAKALLQKKHVLVMFYSRRCQMCSRMRKPLAAVEEQHRAWLEVARLCADDEQTWALELLHYNIDYVPSFVLLNPRGEALAKTTRPRSPQHLIDSLHLLVRHAHEEACKPA